MMKKVLSFFLVLVLMASFVLSGSMTAQAATTKTYEEAVAWIQAAEGCYWDYDGYYGAQCVDLIYFYYEFLGATVKYGNANHYIYDEYSSNGTKLPEGWSRIQYYSGFVAQPGDIALFDYGRYGHVGLVMDGDETGMTTLENNRTEGSGTSNATSGRRSYTFMDFWGVIRPDFSNVVIPPAFYVAGDSTAVFGSEWVADDSANRMTEVSDGIWEITYTNVPVGDYEFKVTDGTWDNCWGVGAGNFKMRVSETCDVTIRFDEGTKDIQASGTAVETGKRIYFNSYALKWTNVYAYAWNEETQAECKSWPGYPMTLMEGTRYVWYYDIPLGATMVVFNDQSLGAQTDDLQIPTDEKNYYSGNVWMVYGPCDHSFENGTCVNCGEADPDYVKPTVAMKFPSLSFEDVIIMNVYYTATDIQNVVEMGLLTYTEKPAEGSVETADHVVPGYDWSEGDQMYYSSTAGIAPKDLGDTIYFGVYWKLTDGTYGYSKILGYSPKTYAMNMLKTGTTEMKTLVAAMLNYGTAAQNYFGYNTDTLVGADMTDEQKALVAAYSDSMIATAEKASGDKLGTFINDKTYSSRYATVTFEGAFCINYYYTPSLAVEGDVMMYVWDLEAFESNAVLTKENATKAIKMSLNDSGEYTAMVDGIAAKDLDKGVYVSFVYNDGTTDHCGGVLTYTIGTYCKTQAAKTGTLAELAKACAVYGYYAKQLFN